MASSIVLEKLLNKHLIFLSLANLVIMILIIIAGSKGPRPANSMPRITKVCNDVYQKFENSTKPIDDLSCTQKIDSIADDNPQLIGNNLVFYLFLPTEMYPQITMSRWFQFMITVLQIQPLQDHRAKLPSASPTLTFKGAVFGRSDEKDVWRQVHTSDPGDTHNRRLECWTDNEYGVKECGEVPLFELGSVHYAHYLINIHFPTRLGYNSELPRLESVFVTEIHQNGGFTKVWVAQKTIVCPILLAATLLFRRQVNRCEKSPLLISKVIQGLGFVNVIFNLPLEYISLWVDAPGLRVWFDCTTGMFYAATAVLWLLFVGEHRMDLDARNKFANYWKEITAVSICCFVMFLFDVIDRGIQISDPFHSIWATETGENTARTLLVVSAGCACFYFLVLLYLMVRAVVSMSRKRASLANVGKVRRLYYEGLISRFKVMVFGTVITGLLTVIMFILINVNEMYYKWGKTENQLEISSGFLVGMAGLWNLYVLNILFLYAPTSFKLTTDDYETVELSEVDVAKGPDALTTLTKPSAD